MSKPRVRFAPSPTGFLHVGGARTAIFNWLYARKNGGVFVLRIEDTDRQRSTDEVVQAILDGMDWLGLEPDEGPFFQSREGERHVADAHRLLEDGKAYRCFCDPGTLKKARQATEKGGRQFVYPRTCRGLSSDEAESRAAAGEAFAVRFRVPEGRVEWDDRVHGTTGFDADLLEDFVIVRSDGTPTYMLSVVSDDAAMGITDVIRGDDHLSNTPKQILLYEALGHEVPRFAHLPLILGEDKKRLSKRHGAVSVLEYRDAGYLADAMFNFLALLGWSPGDDREKLSRDELVEAFNFAGVGKAGAVFDLRKLEWLNGQYLDDLAVEELVPLVRSELERAGLWQEEYDGDRMDWLLKLVALLQPRARKMPDFVDIGRPYLDPSDELEYDPKGVKKHLKGDDLVDRLRALRDRLAALEAWEAEPMETALRSLAEEREISAGKLIHPTRLAVTGRKDSPGLFEVLELLGQDRSLSRLDRLIRFVEERREGPVS
jgi:glutamyl-tRNA synthetase